MRTNRTKTAPAAFVTAERPKGLYLRGETWWYKWRQNGEPHYTSLHTRDYAVAVTLAVRVKASPNFQNGERITDDTARFLAFKKESGIYRRHSGEWAATPLRRLADFLKNKSSDTVTREDLESFWATLRKDVAENSAASYMRAVQSFFSFLLDKHRIKIHPFTGLVLPKVAQAARIRFCSEELRRKLINEAPNWEMQFILYSGMHAGFRKNETVEARPEWFDLERGFVSVDKTPTFEPKDRERRSVPLTKEFLAFLRAKPLTSPFLLRPEVKHGKAIFRYDFRLPFQKYMAAQGCPWVTPHTSRHTFGALYVSDGGSLYRLAGYLGDTIEVTETHYAHLVPDRDDIERGHTKPTSSGQRKRKPAATLRS